MSPMIFFQLALEKGDIITVKTNDGESLMGFYRDNYSEQNESFLFYCYGSGKEGLINLSDVKSINKPTTML
jgi:hypothetical protein